MTRKEVMDVINLRLARLRTSLSNTDNYYQSKEISRAISELEALRQEINDIE